MRVGVGMNTYSMEQSVLEKLTGMQLVKKFPAFHGTRRFITAFTSARHLSLSWATIHSIKTVGMNTRIEMQAKNASCNHDLPMSVPTVSIKL